MIDQLRFPELSLCGCPENNYQPGRRSPEYQKQKGENPKPKIRGGENRARPDRRVKRSKQNTNHGRIDTFERRLHGRAMTEGVPKRQRAEEKEERRQVNRRKANKSPNPTIRRGLHRRSQIGSESEERARNRLRRAITGEESIVADPAAWHDGLLQQRQDDMPPPKTSEPER